MATTTNYGWTTPDDTALVKDGASAIRSLGTAVDTTTKNLNPSTTLGDIEYRSSTANTNTRLAIGSTGNVLTVAGGVPTWAAPAGGGADLLATLSFTSGTSVSSGTLSSAYRQFYILVRKLSFDTGDNFLNLRLNSDSGSNYSWTTWDQANTASVSAATNYAQTSWRIGKTGNTNVDQRNFSSIITINRPSDTDSIYFESKSTGWDGGNYYPHNSWGLYDASAAITSLTFVASANNFATGTALIYGVN